MSANAAASPAPSRSIPWPLFLLVALAGAVTVFGSLALWPDPVQGWLHAARYTARLSFLIFLAPFLASALAYWLPSPATRWMRAKRRYLGLGFALAHFIHLFALVIYLDLSGEGRSLVTLLGGGGAYVMITLMALTSNDWSVSTLGPRLWGWLHWIGIYDIWFVFTFSYFGRVTKDVPQEPRAIYITLFSLALAALALRMATRLARRKRG